MGEWPLRTIGDLVTLQRGIDLPDHSRARGKVPVMGSFGITGRHNKAACRGPGVTVGRSGASAGTVCYIEEDYWPLNTCLYVRDFKNNDPRFAYYFLKTIDLAGMNSGSAQPSLNRNFVHPMPVRFPEPAEQRAIAAVLSALDDKIDLNRRMNETLEASARALFRDWFVDFGPTRGKAEGRPAYLAPDLWSLFPDRLGDDGVPKGWKFGTLADLLVIAPKEPVKSGIPAPYLDMAALPTRGANPDLPTERVYSAGTRFRNGDALLARITPCLENGKTAYVQNLPDDAVGWGSTEFIVLRAKAPIPSPVSYLIARDEDFRRHAIQSMTGTSGRQRANADAIAGYPVAVPDGQDIWEALGSILAPIFDQTAANERESRTLAETRDALLPKLMSGAIRVRGDAARAEALL